MHIAVIGMCVSDVNKTKIWSRDQDKISSPHLTPRPTITDLNNTFLKRCTEVESSTSLAVSLIVKIKRDVPCQDELQTGRLTLTRTKLSRPRPQFLVSRLGPETSRPRQVLRPHRWYVCVYYALFYSSFV